MKETSAKDWRSVTTDVYGTTHKVTGLKPKNDYEFRLRGITEQGPTDYVYSVPLYRRSGKLFYPCLSVLFFLLINAA